MSQAHGPRIDTEKNEIVFGDTSVSLFVEGEGELSIDHTSAADGYVAFNGKSDDCQVTVHLIDRSGGGR